MNKRERVEAALKGIIPDRVPKGEFAVSKGIAEQITGKGTFEGQLQAVSSLGFDFIAPSIKLNYEKMGSTDAKGREILKDSWGRKVTFYDNCPYFLESPCHSLDDVKHLKFPRKDQYSWEKVLRWKKESDLFVFALVDGVFQTLSSLLDFNSFLVATISEKEKLAAAANRVLSFVLEAAEAAIKSGADGIILGEDIAYDKGTFVSPDVLEKVFFPCIKKITSQISVPVVFHADGNLTTVMDSLADLGLAGIHSLQPSAGMDLEEIKCKYGQNLTLIGNFELDDLQKGDKEISEIISKIIEKGAYGGRYMFSSASGILDDTLPVDKIILVYKEVEKQGKY